MCKKSLLMMLLLALIVPWAANAQSPLTIGTGTDYSSTSDGQGSPMARAYYYNSATQFIYTAEELASMGGAKAITSVAFYHNAYSFTDDVRIYLAHTTATTVDVNNPATTATEVYYKTGITVGGSTEGWQTFEFDNSFNYNGTDNLLVIVCRTNASGYSNYQAWQYTETTDNKFMLRHADNTAYANITNTTYAYTASTKRPNIQIAYKEPVTCPKPTLNSEVATTTTTATVSWVPSGDNQTLFDLYWSTENTAPTEATTPSASNHEGTSYELAFADLTPSSTYYVWVRGNCGDENDGWAGPVSFLTPCGAITEFPWSEDFEGYSTGNFSNQCWQNQHVAGSATYVFQVSTSYSHGTSAKQLQLPDMAIGNQVKLRLPEMTLPNTNFVFGIEVYRSNSTYNSSYASEGIRVFASADGEIEGATEMAFIPRQYTVSNEVIPAVEAIGWYNYELPIPMSGTCYIILRGESQYCTSTFIDNFKVELVKPTITEVVSASPLSTTVNWTGNSAMTGYVYQYKLASDTEWSQEYALSSSVLSADITTVAEQTYNFRVKALYGTDASGWATTTFTAPGYCMAPSGLVISNVTSNSADLAWTEEFGDGEWTLLYKTATEEEYTNYGITVTPALMPVTLPSLSGNTVYDVKIYPNCDATKFITDQFTTKCEPIDITAAPYNNTWSKDFTDYNSGIFSDNCWENKHIAGDGTNVFNIYGSWNGYTKVMQLPDMSIGTLTKLMLPAITLPNNNYQFVIDVYRSNSTYNDNYPLEGIRVFASANGEIEGATEMAFIPRQYTVSNDVIPEETAVGWYTYELPIPMSGLCYIILRGESQYCTATYMDNFMVEPAPSCHRPSNLAYTPASLTNHSVTLTWTAPEGQTAWQIAYSDTEFDPNAANFDLNTVNLQNVTGENPTYHFDKTLDADATYYMYVRSNCGTAEAPDYSKWSREGCSFHTRIAKPYPTSLVATEKLPTSMKLGWTIGGGDYETAWDIYYSTSSEDVPTDETEPTIAGVTDNPHLIEGLAANTYYYFYVRSVHSDAGASVWSTDLYTNTPEACPQPSSLTVAEPTPTSLKLSWTAGAEWQTAWIIAYSTTSGFDPTDRDACTYVDAPTNPFVVDLASDQTYYFRVKGACGQYEANSEWNAYEASGTTLVACPAPEITEINDVMPHSAEVVWTGYSETYNLRYGKPITPDPTAPATIILEAHDVWGDGSGYQMLLDADANAYGVLWNASHNILVDGEEYTDGDLPAEYYDEFEYKIPEGADGALTTTNVVVDGSVTITIPAGTYDYVIFNPSPDYDRFYIASSSGEVETAANDYVFEPGMTYHFTMQMFGSNDGAALTITSDAVDWQPVVEGITSPYTIPDLDDDADYYVEVQAVCGAITGEWSESAMFHTPSACTAPTGLSTANVTYDAATLNWATDYYLENFDVQYRIAEFDGYYFYEDFDPVQNSWYVNNLETGGGFFATSGIDGSRCFGFKWTTNTPQYLISTELMDGVEGKTLTFYYRAYSSYYPESFQVIFRDENGNVISTEDEVTGIDNTEEWLQYESSPIPAGTKSFVISCTSYNAYYLFVDNFSIYDENDIQEAGEWNTDNTNIEANTLTITGLDAETMYEWQVKGYSEFCTEGTAWSASDYFTTAPLPTQTIALTAGVNWFSTYLDITLNDLKAALLAAVPGTAISIKAKSAYTNYTGGRWRGTLNALDVKQMYMITVAEDCEITLQGAPLNPAELPITIKPGVNWIGYPLSTEMPIGTAFAGFAVTNDKVTARTSFANYTGRWRGTLTTLEPGKGYIYKSNASSDRTLVFPSGRSTQSTTVTYPTSEFQTKALPLSASDSKSIESKTSFSNDQQTRKAVKLDDKK